VVAASVIRATRQAGEFTARRAEFRARFSRQKSAAFCCQRRMHNAYDLVVDGESYRSRLKCSAPDPRRDTTSFGR
jgi:hypothetical protein